MAGLKNRRLKTTKEGEKERQRMARWPRKCVWGGDPTELTNIRGELKHTTIGENTREHARKMITQQVETNGTNLQ